VIATTIGVGPEAAARTTERVLSTVSVDHVVVCGIAGGVGPHREIGSMVVPDRVLDGATRRELRPDALNGVPRTGTILTVGELVLDHEHLGKLAAEGIDALDMESSAVGDVCGRLGYRWSVFRSISDNASEGVVDDSVLGLLHEDGSVNVGAAVRLILTHPGRLPRLARLAKDSSVAARAAAKAAIGAISQ
jgi:nucleoside phosphorylase